MLEFTGDLRLALDAQPLSQSPALSDSLDITSELAEPTPAATAPSDEQPSSPPPTAVFPSDQLPVKLKLDLSKPSAAGGM